MLDAKHEGGGMSKRESKGGYAGGGTVFSPKDPSWFSKGSTRVRPNDQAALIPDRSPSEQAAYEAFVKQATEAKFERKYALIKRTDPRPLNKKGAKISPATPSRSCESRPAKNPKP